MSISKAAADAIEASKEAEGTNVLSKEQIESRVEIAKRLYAKVNRGRKATLKDKIEFAVFLLETKREFKNEFYQYITDDVISRKQVGRYIKLILKTESVKNYAKGMSHKNKEPEQIEANISLLVEDENVVSLTVEQIDTMIEPTVPTIETAKLADSKEDFLKAIAGDKKVLEAIKDKKSADSKAKKVSNEKKAQEEIAEKRPENMDVDKYNSLLKEDKPTLIAILQEQIDEANALRDELADLRKLAENAKYYDLDKNKSSSNTKKKTEEA